jgi:hypothetical protein
VCYCDSAKNSERVIFVVFGSTPRHGAELTPHSFDSNLVSGTQSVARASLVTRGTFDGQVVDTGVPAKGPFLGIAVADVFAIRQLTADIVLPDRPHKVRAVCVLDRVDEGEFDGHATMGYSKALGARLGEKQRGVKRATVRLDLAIVFSETESAEHHPWPSVWDLRFRRLVSVIGVLWQSIRSLVER